MLTEKQIKAYKSLVEVVKNLENDLKNKKVESFMIPLVEDQIARAKALIEDYDSIENMSYLL